MRVAQVAVNYIHNFFYIFLLEVKLFYLSGCLLGSLSVPISKLG